MYFKKMMARIKATNLIGEVTGVDLKNQLVAIYDEQTGKTHNEKIDNVDLYEEAFTLKDVTIYNRDVLHDSKYDNHYLIELFFDGEVQIHLLDEEFEIKKSGKKFSVTEDALKGLENLERLGNYHIIKAQLPKEPDFNIVVVKADNTYYYACNNKPEKEIDLIKVVFIGFNLIKEEDYDRVTLSYKDYNTLVTENELEEVSQSEFMRYASNLMTNAKNNEVDEGENEPDNPFAEEEDDESVLDIYDVDCVGCEDCDCEKKQEDDNQTESTESTESEAVEEYQCPRCKNNPFECDCPW